MMLKAPDGAAVEIHGITSVNGKLAVTCMPQAAVAAVNAEASTVRP
jgi:hypothetical protein